MWLCSVFVLSLIVAFDFHYANSRFIQHNGALPHYIPVVLYAAALHAPLKSKKETNTESIMDTIRKVKVNIPLLDAIKQVPAYAKFLKDLCTQKHKSRVYINKQVRLTEHVSSILLVHIPPKIKDLGNAPISCVIDNYTIDRAILDLGVSVNLLPYSICKQFNLGKLKPTLVTLSFIDRSVKRPRGVIEDVLVKVKEFYYPVALVVLDMEFANPTKYLIPVLSGRPFLATANACIQCRIGIMDASFGNMQLQLNVFHASQYPPNDVKSLNVDMIEECVEEVAPSILRENPIEDILQPDNPSMSGLEDLYE
ncbi:uncharacterized protein LOC131143887 [Malania oleifera]|uniref:uncharacterized protein LOC131143887 n=1 Tax=Malania oleifera TaxID=397392 RepID=UPI0025AE1981|nr:uncharacterized protein LOC131143887 [Malania oleifera]